jgi:peroxiredoxin
MRDVSQRSAFLIGQDGVVRGAWLYDVTELPDFDVLLAAAQSL